MFHQFDTATKSWLSRHPAPVIDPEANLAQLILTVLDRNPEKVLQIDADTGRELTAAEMRLRAIRVAQNLTELGFRKGDMAAVVCSNSENLAPLVLGLWMVGMPFVGLPVGFNGDDLGHLMGLVQPKLVFCDDSVYKAALEDAGKALKIKPVVFAVESEMESIRKMDELLKSTGKEAEFVPQHLGDMRDLIGIILCTSGTTGRPKGVAVSQAHISIVLGKPVKANESDLVFNFSPLYWGTGNAKTLDSSSGYWAESLPAMETPLCAVVDPVRDFRWHALRCGGPETAAFLCELPVPTWATDCTVTSMPSLTVQYMSDSGAVQLARDCGELGTRHMSCQSKLDRDTILQQLQCGDQETDPAQVAATENNQLPEAGSAVPQQASRTPPPQILEHDILTVVSNNDEDNNIDVNPNQIEDTVKNVINKFNLADLLQNDQSLHSGEMDGHYVGQEKESKKMVGKKYSPLFEKKEKYGKKGDHKADEDEEMMMGDQPDETETQPIDIVQQAVKPTEGDSDESSTSGVVGSSTGGAAASSEVAGAESTTVDSRLRRATDGEAAEESTLSSTTVEASTTTVTTTTTMEPTSSSTASHILPTTPKKEISAIGDHFIPPMLLVKARFTSTKAHVDSTTTTEIVTETSEPKSSSTSAPASTSEEITTAILTEETYSVSDNGSDIQIVEFDVKTSSPETSTSSEADVTTAHQVVEITFDDKEMTSKLGTLSITTRPFTSDEPQSTIAAENATATPTTPSTTVVLPSTTTTTTTTIAPPSTTASPPSSTTSPTVPTLKPKTSYSFEQHELHHDLGPDAPSDVSDEQHEDNEADHRNHEELHNSFSNIENYQPYKPNRHRSLTKPEVHNNHGNYIKKILG